MSESIVHDFVPRFFREVALSETEETQNARPLEDFFSQRVIVVLGEPGLGKTTEFERAAAQEPNATYLRLGRFLTSGNPSQWRNQVLYLDGLDEHRARVADQTVMDNLIGQLEITGCPKLRLSCRTQEWHQGSDVKSLAEVNNGEKVTILELQPLTHDNIRTIVDRHGVDSETFFADAVKYGVDNLLTNPLTLSLLLNVIKEEGWPETKRDLFEKACVLLLKEENEAHVRNANRSFSEKALQQAADELAAACLLGGSEGIALSAVRAKNGFPSITTLGNDVAILQEAARRNLFIPIEPERIAPRHRTLGEFMTARCLAHKIIEGLPLGRVCALITGYDDNPIPDLRGVFAWLACLLPPESASLLLQVDPYGAAVYGDPASWPLSMCKTALEQMRRLSDDNPWVLDEHWNNRSLGGLARPELVKDFRAILKETGQNRLRNVVLDILRYGKALPKLGCTLRRMVLNEQNNSDLRAKAAEAFIHCCPDHWGNLQTALDGIYEDRIVDSYLRLYGTLLRLGYPKHISPQQIIRYIQKEKPLREVHWGAFEFFLSLHLLNATPEDSLIFLADELTTFLASTDSHTHRELHLKLLKRIFALNHASLSPEKIYHWLGGMLTEWGMQTVEENETQEIRSYIQERPDLYKALFNIWLKKDADHGWGQFDARVCSCPPPSDFSQYLLKQAKEEPDDKKANFIFREMGKYIGDSITIDDLYAFTEAHPRFASVLKNLIFCELREGYFDQRIRAVEWSERDQHVLDGWREHSDELRYARHLSGLSNFAGYWLNFNCDNQSADDQFLERYGQELTDAVFAGFEETLRKDDLPSIAEISKNIHDNMLYYHIYPMLAGIDRVATRSLEELISLPANILALAFTAALVVPTGNKHEWVNKIIEAHPELASETLAEIWRVQLDSQTNPVGIYGLFKDGKPPMPNIGGVVLDLLRDYPNAPEQTLRIFLHIALQQSDAHDQLQSLVRDALSEANTLDLPSKVAWLCTGYWLTPDEYEKQLEDLVRQSPNDAVWEAYKFWSMEFNAQSKPPLLSSTAQKVVIARLLTRSFDNIQRSPDMWVTVDRDPESAASHIRRFIQDLAQDPSKEMTEALKELHEGNTLQTWKPEIAYSMVKQARIRREKEFQYPSAEQIVATLAGGAPANAADLQALVMDVLADIAKHLRHGNSDAWKGFWNTGNDTTPKVENDCRDYLMDPLHARLEKCGLHIEREVDHAAHKRSDLTIYQGHHRKLPIEIKRMQNDSLWTGMNEQLIKQYCDDPKCEDRGIYLVLWFGAEFIKKIPTLHGQSKPTTPEDLEKALIGCLKPSHKNLVKIIVLDVSKP